MYIVITVLSSIILSCVAFFLLVRFYPSSLEFGIYICKQVHPGCCHHCCECGLIDNEDIPDFDLPKQCPTCEEMISCEGEDISNFSCPVCETRLVAVSHESNPSDWHWERLDDVRAEIEKDQHIPGDEWKYK